MRFFQIKKIPVFSAMITSSFFAKKVTEEIVDASFNNAITGKIINPKLISFPVAIYSTYKVSSLSKNKKQKKGLFIAGLLGIALHELSRLKTGGENLAKGGEGKQNAIEDKEKKAVIDDNSTNFFLVENNKISFVSGGIEKEIDIDEMKELMLEEKSKGLISEIRMDVSTMTNELFEDIRKVVEKNEIIIREITF